MNHYFKRLPLAIKLILISIIPLFFLLYLAVQFYNEKEKNARLFKKEIEQIHQSAHISTLIDNLQLERRYSFENSLHHNKIDEMNLQRTLTDSIIISLRKSESQSIQNFEKFTFLDQLQNVRRAIDSGLSNEIIMHYYTTAIFRLGTLSPISPFTSVYLQTVYNNLISQRLLTEMLDMLGTLRTNIYNVLYTGKNGIGTLYGIRGVYDVYKSYETEFLLKASQENVIAYNSIRNNSSLGATMNYLDARFASMSFDSAYKADNWWQLSEKGINELRSLQHSILNTVIAKLNDIYNHEKTQKNRTLILLVVAVAAVIILVSYTLYVLRKDLKQMKQAAIKLAKGATGIHLNITSNDAMGTLARSINMIDKNYQLLANTALAVGKGDFDIPLQPRGPEDVLGKALIEMKYELQELTRQQKLKQQQIAAAVVKAQEEERTRMGEELHDNVNQILGATKLYVDVMKTHPEKREELLQKVTEQITTVIKEIRTISNQLILPELRGSSLLAAIENIVTEIKMVSPMSIELDVGNFDETYMAQSQKIAVYRIVQEQLNNILKYSGASSAMIKLENRSGQFLLLVNDNGKGFDIAKTKKGVGFTNIINRAELLNGVVDIDSSPGNGCRLTISLATA